MNLSVKGISPLQRKIIIPLIIIAVLLFIVNFTLGLFWNDSVLKVEHKEEIDTAVIKKVFKESLYDLGFEDNWIKPLTKGNKFKSSEEKTASYSVSVPADLPITIILNEIFISFKKYDVHVKSEEQKINGKTLLEVSSRNKPELNAEFYYDKSINRNAGNIGIFVTGITNLVTDDIKIFLSLPETFELLLIPSKNAGELLKTLNDFKKKYGILFNDVIPDIEYKLSSKYSKARLKSSIRNILGNFSEATIFMIDDKSKLYSSDVYPLLEEEFNKRKLKLIPEDSLSNLSESNTNVLENFKETIEMTKRGQEAEFIVTAEEFKLLQKEIARYRKVGYKFVLPSELINSK